MTAGPAQQTAQAAPEVVTGIAVFSPALVVMALVVAAYGAMETMIAPIIPFVQAKMHATSPQIAWMFTGLLLVGAVALPLLGRLAEVFDKRNVVIASLLISSIGAVMTALAPNVEILIAGQSLQGVGIGAQPIAFSMVRDIVPPKQVGAATAFLSGTGSSFAAIGLLVTGPILGHLGYAFVYWIPVAIIVVGVIGMIALLPKLPSTARRSIDWPGALILGGGFALLLIGLTLSSTNPWLSFQVLGLMVIGTVGAIGFAFWERRAQSPLLDLQAMKQRDVGLTIVIMAFMGLAQFTLFTIMPSLSVVPASTGYGMGGDGTTASLVVFVFVAVASLAQFCLPPIRRLIGARGVLILQGGCLILAAIPVFFIGHVHWLGWLTMAVGGFGLGIGSLQTVNIILDRVAQDRVPSVVSSLWVVRSIGGTFGSQITAAILVANIAAGATIASFSGYAESTVLVVIGGIAIVVLAAAMTRGRGQGHRLGS